VSGAGSSHLAFDWMLNFPGLLDPRTDAQSCASSRPSLRTGGRTPSDSFSGVAWLSSGSFGERLTAEGTAGSDTFDVPQGDPAAQAGPSRRSSRSRSLYTDFLFTGGSPKALVFGRHVPVFTNSVLALRLRRPLGPTFTYALTALVPQVKPARPRRARPRLPAGHPARHDAALPAATSVTGTTAQGRWRAAMDDTPPTGSGATCTS